MPQRRHHALFLLCVAAVSATLLCGCEAPTAQRQQQQAVTTTSATATATTTAPICYGNAVDWAYAPTVAQLKSITWVIVVGAVVRRQAGTNALCDIDAVVRVDRTVYNLHQQIMGTMLVVRTDVPDDAKLSAGDHLVLFLYPDTAPATKYRVVDDMMGATHIIDGMVRPWSGGGPMPLDAYLAQIEHA
jgi:hypothetical protein